ncbi:MAG: hypothetical protein ABW088_13925, partial [Sedimenticola sp.]
SCFSCHNGITAQGKSPGHIPSGNTCDDCHTTRTWLGAVFDHSSTTTSCTTCHNGIQATGKSVGHITTSAQCDSCHSTLGWLPARFDHSSASGSCSSCHNGIQATGKPSRHFVTSLQCDECHSTHTWSSINYRHTGNYPGDHRGGLTCTSCHQANSQTVTWSHAGYQPDCAGCHAGDFRQSAHEKVKDRSTYTVSELRDCTGSCHVYRDSSMTTIEEHQSGEHRVGSGEW